MGCKMWFHIGCLQHFPGEHKPEAILGLDFFKNRVRLPVPEPFLKYLLIPIERGGLSGLVGNGRDQLWIRTVWRDAIETPNWSEGVRLNYLKGWEEVTAVYFHCATCDRVI